MAIESLSVLTETGEGKAYLAQVYGPVIENVFKENISTLFKNDDIYGDIKAGTIVARKFANTGVNKLGTARTNGKGDNIKAQDINIDLDDDIEKIHEVSEKDVKTYGVEGLVQRRAAQDQVEIAKYIEEKFWAEAATAGKQFTSTATGINKKVNAAIVDLEKTKDNFVKGVPRSLMGLVLSPEAYTELQDYIDEIKNHATGNTYEVYHKVQVFCSTDLPDGVDGVLLCKKSIAQPFLPLEVTPGKIPLSTSYAFGIAGSLGTKATSPELIRVLTGLTTEPAAE